MNHHSNTKLTFKARLLMQTMVGLALSLSLFGIAAAHEGHEDAEDSTESAVSASDVLFERNLRGSEGSGRIANLHMRLHKAGHDLDQPFTLEFRAQCSGKKELGPVFDTISACDVALNSIDFDPVRQTATVIIREPDLALLEKRSLVQSLKEESRLCKARPKKLRIHLSHGCTEATD